MSYAVLMLVLPVFFVLLFFCLFVVFFFFNDTATTEIYTLSLHDALPICSSMKLNSVIDVGLKNDVLLDKRRGRCSCLPTSVCGGRKGKS